MEWELKWMQRANRWWSSPYLNRVLPWLTHLGSTVAVLVFIVSSWLFTEQTGILYRLVLLYVIQSGISYGLKYSIRRHRPPPPGWKFTKLEIIDPSFPSMHTLSAFMMATVLSHWFPPYRPLFLAGAGFVGWTRLYLGLHFPSDVVAGGILGYGVTSFFLRQIGISLVSSYA